MRRFLAAALLAAAGAAAACSGGTEQGTIEQQLRESDRCYAIVDRARHEFDCAAWERITIGNYWTESLGKPPPQAAPPPEPPPEPKPEEPKTGPKPDRTAPGDRRHGRVGSWFRDKVYGK